MSYVIAAPEMLATAAADVDGIGSAIRAASASAAGPTTGLLAAAADEVSSAAAALFSEYARECQEVLKQAAAFHGEFTRALAAPGPPMPRLKPATPLLCRAPPGPAAPSVLSGCCQATR